MEIFKYSDEDDKCLGIAGMAISMVVWDNEDLLSSVSLDAQSGESIEFTPQYYFAGDPKMSAKASWTQIIEHYQITMGMLIANVMCRHYTQSDKPIENKTKDTIFSLLEKEGKETCSLEKDEIERLFDKTYDYLNRVFMHHGVQTIANDLASSLKQSRKMTRSEIMEHLEALSEL